MKPLRICLVEPFFTGSHQRWAEELQAKSRHQIELLTLPGRHWKWRMHGAAVTLAQRLLERGRRIDLLLATDMLDLSVFLSLIRRDYGQTPVALYFHENQLSYPWSPQDSDPQDQRDLHYAFINYASALSADRVYFNSDYHRDSFLDSLKAWLSRYPDYRNLGTLDGIERKSQTLPLGLDLRALDSLAGSIAPDLETVADMPILLWNHRWEYDKNPQGFCKLLLALESRGVAFQVAILGKSFDQRDGAFAALEERLRDRIVAFGEVTPFEDYGRWLWKSHILPVTSRQDFFGGSVIEAIYCGCHPLLPHRLAYPEHISPSAHPDVFYATENEAVDRLEQLIRSGAWRRPSGLASQAKIHDWSARIDHYDAAFEHCALSRPAVSVQFHDVAGESIAF